MRKEEEGTDMAVRQYALHFNLPEGCLVCLSTVVSFFLVFAFGVYIGKEVQAHKTAQETRTVRFPVDRADHEVSVSPVPQTFPLTSKRRGEKENRNSPPPATPPVGESVALNSAPALPNKKQEPIRTAPAPSEGPTQDKKKPQVPGGWRIQVHVTKSPRTARQLAAELRTRGYTASVNRLTKNGETLYRLRVGTFTQEEARRVAARFRREEKFAQAYLVSD